LERTQNRDVIAQCKALSWNLAEGTEEDHWNLCEDRFPDRDPNRTPTEYK
jgi:hypothetical protein